MEQLLYTEFYKLSGRPFQLTPDPRFYFDSRTHRKAMAYLSYGLNQGEGFIIITGDIGAGKTTLVGHLFETLDPRHFLATKVVSTQLDADDTLRMVAGAFGIASQGVEKSTILQQLERFLRTQAAQERRVLLIVDEAQNLPVSALEELRMLSNYQDGERALLQIFLLGQPEFRDKLANSSELEQLRQRVIATHHLEPMGLEEVSEYIHHRLALVGWENDPVFTEDAFEAIHRFTGGVPRRLNTLCSRILLYGAIEELHEINGAVVAEVIADLKTDATPASMAVGHGNGEIGKSNVPPKIRLDRARSANGAASEGVAAAMLQRIDHVETRVKSHDKTLHDLLGIIGEWIEAQASQDGR